MENIQYEEIKKYILSNPDILFDRVRMEGLILDLICVEKPKIFSIMLPYNYGIIKHLINGDFTDNNKNKLCENIYLTYGIEKNFLLRIFDFWCEIFDNEFRCELINILNVSNIKNPKIKELGLLNDKNINDEQNNNTEDVMTEFDKNYDRELASFSDIIGKSLNILKRNGIKTVLDLCSITKSEMKNIVKNNCEAKNIIYLMDMLGVNFAKEKKNVITNYLSNYKNPYIDKNYANIKYCYLEHFAKYNFGLAEFEDEELWWSDFCESIRIISSDFNCLDVLCKIKEISFICNCDIEKKEGLIVNFDKNKNCILKLLCKGDKLYFYTNADKFIIPNTTNTVENSYTDYLGGFFSVFFDLEVINGLGNIDTSFNSNLGFLFAHCKNLRSLEGLSKWKVKNVLKMSGMFIGCSNLNEIDISSWDTSNVEYMDYMFADCSNLNEIDISSWDLSNAEDLHGMFAGCRMLKSTGVYNWLINGNCYIYDMFDDCDNLKSIKINGKTIDSEILNLDDEWEWDEEGNPIEPIHTNKQIYRACGLI